MKHKVVLVADMNVWHCAAGGRKHPHSDGGLLLSAPAWTILLAYLWLLLHGAVGLLNGTGWVGAWAVCTASTTVLVATMCGVGAGMLAGRRPVWQWGCFLMLCALGVTWWATVGDSLLRLTSFTLVEVVYGVEDAVQWVHAQPWAMVVMETVVVVGWGDVDGCNSHAEEVMQGGVVVRGIVGVEAVIGYVWKDGGWYCLFGSGVAAGVQSMVFAWGRQWVAAGGGCPTHVQTR